MKIHLRLVSILFFAASNIAGCQQQTGTILVWRIFPDHAVIAADSKVSHTCPGVTNPIVGYDVCKILTFDDQYVFAATGYTGRFDPCQSSRRLWDVRQLTTQLYQEGKISTTDDFARKWATKMNAVLSEDARISPPSHHNGLVLGGLFIGISKGQLSTEMVSFQLDRDGHARPQLFVIHPSDQPDDAGEDRVLIEFEDNKTPRAKLWHRRIDKLKPDDQIAALAKLVEDFEVSAGVGGPIDSVRITPFGVQWLSAKPECGPHPTKPRK
ncbi:MAG: hypothetical protein ABSF93_07425 [Candidatus Sulfotelmatobacter sp.]